MKSKEARSLRDNIQEAPIELMPWRRKRKPMKALMLSEHRNLQVVNFPEPTCASNEVLIRVAACSVCGSDVHGYQGSSWRRIPPIVTGHEAAGIIEHVGAEVKDYEAGDHVPLDSTIEAKA